jgi:hypothetical protein
LLLGLMGSLFLLLCAAGYFGTLHVWLVCADFFDSYEICLWRSTRLVGSAAALLRLVRVCSILASLKCWECFVACLQAFDCLQRHPLFAAPVDVVAVECYFVFGFGEAPL